MRHASEIQTKPSFNFKWTNCKNWYRNKDTFTVLAVKGNISSVNSGELSYFPNQNARLLAILEYGEAAKILICTIIMPPKETLPYLTQYFFTEKEQRFPAWNFPNDSFMKTIKKNQKNQWNYFPDWGLDNWHG